MKGTRLIILMIPILMFSCALDKFVVDSMYAGAGMSSLSTFTAEKDTRIVKDAFPSLLKLQELVLSKSPKNPKILLSTGSLYVMYAAGFLLPEAEQAGDTDFQLKEDSTARAKYFLLKGHGFLAQAADKLYPGFNEAFRSNAVDPFLSKIRKKDVALFYWYTAAWLSVLSLDSLDMDFNYQIPSIGKLIDCLIQLDRTYSQGALLSLAVNYYASVPDFLGGNLNLAHQYFDEALKVSGAGKVGLYVLAAKLFAIPEQDKEYFQECLRLALSIKPEDFPLDALSVSLSLEQAKWFSSHESDYFL